MIRASQRTKLDSPIVAKLLTGFSL